MIGLKTERAKRLPDFAQTAGAQAMRLGFQRDAIGFLLGGLGFDS